MHYKIGFLIGSLSGAGAEKTILTLSRAFQDMGCNVVLYVLTDQADYEIHSGEKVVFLGGGRLKDLGERLQKKTEEECFDLFVTSRAEFYDYVVASKRVCSVHITPTAWLKKRFFLVKWKTYLQTLKLKKKFANKNLIALSEGIKTDLVENLEIPSERVKVIPNPYDLEQIHRLGSEPLCEGMGSYIIYVAALIPRKRQTDLIRAFAALGRRDIKLLLLGKGPDEELLKKLSNDLRIMNQVVFLGWTSNPYKYIKNAKLSMLVSEAEGLPRVLIESLILGVPVVSTDCPSGPSEILQNELRPFLVPVGDVESLTNTMRRALNDYPDYQHIIDFKRLDRFAVAKSYLQLMEKERG